MKNNFSHKLFHISLVSLIIAVFVSVVSAQNMFRKVNDFDGDGRADYAITRNENGYKYWYVWQSTAGFRVFQWGLDFDQNASGDYDGDGKTDVAVWRPPTTNGNSSTYYILESQTNTFRFHSFSNFMLSRMMHQDYNGDGKIDAGVQTGESNPTLSAIYSGSESGFTSTFPGNYRFGIRIGDMDGDGRADRASYDTLGGQTVLITNLVTDASRLVDFGVFNDQYQLADFDGDGIGDLTVFRQSDGTWWWIRSSDNVVNATTWGQNGDRPVPADYDGDGKTDLAIWRDGYYWIYGSRDGISVFNWGLSTDTPVTY